MAVYFAKYGTAWDLQGYPLVDRVTGQYKSNPTLATGDFKLEKDGGTAANLTTLPTVTPTGGTSIKISFSEAEMQCQQATLKMIDAAGNEWNDDSIHIFTYGDPSAHEGFDRFSPTVGLSAASISQLVASFWGALRATYSGVAGSYGEGVASVQGDVTGAVGSVTGNVGGSVVGVVGGVAANGITSASFATDALSATALSQAAAQKISDEILNRNLAGGGSGSSRNVRNALRTLRNRVRVNGGSFEVYEEDDTTLAWTATATTSASNPVTEIDPS